MIDFLKNVSVNLKATGPAAVLIVWLICFTCITIYAEPDARIGAVMVMMFAFAGIISAMGTNDK